MTIGSKIFLLRTQMNISQEKLADELRVSRQSISKWETDQSIPELDKIQMLSQFFNITVESLINDELDVEKKNLDRNQDLFVKTNNFKRVARILLLTTTIMAIIYLIYFFLSIIFQSVILKYYGASSDKFIFPIMNILTNVIRTFCYIFFPLKIYQNINRKSIVFEIVALSIVVVALNIITNFLSQLDLILMQQQQIEYHHPYLILSSHLSKIGYFNIISNAIFVIATTISLVIKKLDGRAYITPPLKENENVRTGFKVLAFFMGLSGVIIVWVLSFILINEWKKDQPIRKSEFKKYFLTGMVIAILVLVIITLFRLIIKKMI